MFRKAKRPSMIAFLLFASSLSVGAAQNSGSSPIEQARLVGTTQLDGELFHVQGLELDATRVWVTSIDRRSRKAFLHQFERGSGKFVRRIELTDGARYHPGGISIAGTSMWVPVAEMRPRSSAVLLEIDLQTMQVKRRIAVNDHLGCVAVSGQTLVAGNWDSRQFHIIDLTDPAKLQTVNNPSRTAFQDIKFVGNQLVAAGSRSLWSGTLDWIDWPGLTVTRSLRAGAVGTVRPFGRGGAYTSEGMAIEGRDLYVVPEDGPSRLFHFRLSDS
jgi:hypothetical protein